MSDSMRSFANPVFKAYSTIYNYTPVHTRAFALLHTTWESSTLLVQACSSYSGLWGGGQTSGRVSPHCHHSSPGPPLKNQGKHHETKMWNDFKRKNLNIVTFLSRGQNRTNLWWISKASRLRQVKQKCFKSFNMSSYKTYNWPASDRIGKACLVKPKRKFVTLARSPSTQCRKRMRRKTNNRKTGSFNH